MAQSELINFILINPTIPVIVGSVGIAYANFKTQRHLTRSKNAIDFESEYHGEIYEKVIVEAREYLKYHTADELIALANETSTSIRHVPEILNIWERAAIAVRHDVYDEHVLFEAYASTFLWFWVRSRPYILEVQKRNEKAYVKIDWLATR